MTDFVPEGAFELAGCPRMGGLGEPRVPGYTGGSGGGGSTRYLMRGEQPEWQGRFPGPGYIGINPNTGERSRYINQTDPSNTLPMFRYRTAPVVPGVRYRPGGWFSDTHVGGLGTFYVNGVGNCVPCGVSGLGAFSIESLGLGFNLKTLIIVVAAAFAASVVARQMKKGKRRNRRRNAPFAVKGVFGAIGPARAAYAAMPGGGYKSLIDVNRRKGRSGRYSSRKIVAQHRLSPGAF